MLFRKARIWVCKQRIEELENALRHWPLSDKIRERQEELRNKKQELEELESSE